MKKVIVAFAAFFVIAAGSRAQNGYSIALNIKPFASQWVYLGYYFGKALPIKDSLKLDAAGKGVFKGAEKLPAGIYLVGYPGKKQFFELLVEKHQHFSITVTDTAGINSKIAIKNAPDAQEFQEYQRFMEKKGREFAAINEQFAKAGADEKTALNNKRKTLNDAVQAYRKGILAKNTGALLPAIFEALREPVVPEGKLHPGGKYDSAWAWQYYKSHFWDGVNFADDRLLRTPVFEPRFDQFFKEIVYPSPDSIKKEADKVLAVAQQNREMFKFIMSKLIQRYINPEYMGQDAVYVHLFEKYVANGQVDWYDEKQKKYLFDRAYSLMANIIGEKAAPLELVDTSGAPRPLYDINADYTVICFWDATCGHCKEVVPKVDSVFQNKWKGKGIALYGVMTDGGKDAWMQYIREHNLNGWVHVYEPEGVQKADAAAGRPNYRQLYDIISTPKLYLLDKNKHIIAKQLTCDQLDDLLQKKMAGR